jgi:hypothetical protein
LKGSTSTSYLCGSCQYRVEGLYFRRSKLLAVTVRKQTPTDKIKKSFFKTMMAASEAKPLFPSIGSLADDTDHHAQETDSAQAPDTAEDNVVQSIDSLCMKCGEQVRGS